VPLRARRLSRAAGSAARRPRRHDLPSRRRQGAGCAGGDLRAAAGRPRRGPRSAARLRQHVGGHRALRPRADAAARIVRALPDVGARPRLHRRLPADRRRVSPAHIILAAVTLQRLVELVVSRRNAARLIAQGGIEVGRQHYPAIVALHAAWLAALWLLVPADTVIRWPFLGLFLVLQVGRIWVLWH